MNQRHKNHLAHTFIFCFVFFLLLLIFLLSIVVWNAAMRLYLLIGFGALWVNILQLRYLLLLLLSALRKAFIMSYGFCYSIPPSVCASSIFEEKNYINLKSFLTYSLLTRIRTVKLFIWFGFLSFSHYLIAKVEYRCGQNISMITLIE